MWMCDYLFYRIIVIVYYHNSNFFISTMYGSIIWKYAVDSDGRIYDGSYINSL